MKSSTVPLLWTLCVSHFLILLLLAGFYFSFTKTYTRTVRLDQEFHQKMPSLEQRYATGNEARLRAEASQLLLSYVDTEPAVEDMETDVLGVAQGLMIIFGASAAGLTFIALSIRKRARCVATL